MSVLRSITSYRILLAGALFCSLILVCADAKYGIIRQFPDDYDETYYINEVCTDRSIVMKQGLVGFARQLVFSEDKWRPPGYRLAGFLVGLASEPSPAILRLLSLLSLALTALILFLSGKEISGKSAGLLWASGFAFSMGVFSTAWNFGTETTLYLALAGCLYGLARWFHKVRADAITIVVLALSTALGLLSKVSFFPVFVPLLGAAVLLAPETDRKYRSLLAVLGSVAAGALIAIPWWLINWQSALVYAYWSSHHYPSGRPWLTEAATSLLGVPFTVGFLIFLSWTLLRANSLWKKLTGTTRNFVGVCLAGCLPLLILQTVSVNHLMRLLTPALLPGIGVVAVLLHAGSVLDRRFVSAFIALVLATQTGMLAWQSSHWAQEPWDWEPLRELARGHGLLNPTIVHIGYSPTYNPPQIQYPWACHGEVAFVQWVFAHDNPPFDWNKLDNQIKLADIVLVAPRSLFGSPLEGQNNDELLRRLREKSDVWTPVNLYLGQDSKTSILVFFRNVQRGQ
jgi:4-amino-4-deoxy-L-arabinose transferase-like glycosyltransferase